MYKYKAGMLPSSSFDHLFAILENIGVSVVINKYTTIDDYT